MKGPGIRTHKLYQLLLLCVSTAFCSPVPNHLSNPSVPTSFLFTLTFVHRSSSQPISCTTRALFLLTACSVSGTKQGTSGILPRSSVLLLKNTVKCGHTALYLPQPQLDVKCFFMEGCSRGPSRDPGLHSRDTAVPD